MLRIQFTNLQHRSNVNKLNDMTLQNSSLDDIIEALDYFCMT